MKVFCVVTCLIFVVFGLSFESRAQLVSDEFCKEVENLVATPLRPAHWYRNIVFNDECDMEFDIDHKGGIGISFSLERFTTKEEARKSFRSDKEMFDNAVYDQHGRIVTRPQPIYPTLSYWNEALFYDFHGPMLLRKEKSVVTIFCDKRDLCEEIEEKLRRNKTLFDF